MLEPIYDTNIIVGIKINNKIEWYILDKYMCFMTCDDIKFKKDTKEIRQQIPNISEKNVILFLKLIEKYKLNIDKIRMTMLEAIQKRKSWKTTFQLF